MTAYEDKIVEEVLQHFAMFSADRSVFENHWDEVARQVWPAYRNTFTSGNFNVPGEKKTSEQIDSTAALALHRFMAICDSLLTPRNQKWHLLGTDNEDLNKNREVKLWFEKANNKLFKLRYAPTSGFAAQNQQIWKQLGAFGNGPMFIDELLSDDGTSGLRYKALPLGEVYLMENHQGIIDGFLRRFMLTARQVQQLSVKWKFTIPAAIEAKLAKNPEFKFEFYHCVKPRADFDPERYDSKGKRYGSYYVSKEGKQLIREGGFYTLPLAVSRYDNEPGEVYARSPAMMVLPAIKTLNSQKRIVLKQGHRTVDPVLLTHDDGAAGISMKPGALNKGGVNADGRPLVHTLPIGRVDIGLDMMDREIAVINDAFLVNLFQVLLDDPKVMTATQVVEMANEKGILLAPTVGRQSDYLGLVIERELDLATELHLLDPMPPALVEAKGEYQVTYTSPLAKAARAQEAAGFERSVESTLAIVNVTQDPSPLDHYNFDKATPELADIRGVPPSWMNDPKVIAAVRQQRSQQMQAQQDIQAAPGAAALIKAQAVARKGGQKATA